MTEDRERPVRLGTIAVILVAVGCHHETAEERAAYKVDYLRRLIANLEERNTHWTKRCDDLFARVRTAWDSLPDASRRMAMYLAEIATAPDWEAFGEPAPPLAESEQQREHWVDEVLCLSLRSWERLGQLTCVLGMKNDSIGGLTSQYLWGVDVANSVVDLANGHRERQWRREEGHRVEVVAPALREDLRQAEAELRKLRQQQ